MKKLRRVLGLIPFTKRIYKKFKIWHYSRMKFGGYLKELERWYKLKTGEPLNIEIPVTFNEKIQWLKLYDSTDIKTWLADKFRVREWVAEKIGEEYLIPLLGVWEKAEDIDFDALPEKFVLKANHGSGFNIIVEDKSKMNTKNVRKQLNDWLKINYAFSNGFEWHYKNINPLIIAEEYMKMTNDDLLDYRFMCFNGEPRYCALTVKNEGIYEGEIYDMDWNLQLWKFEHYRKMERPITKPNNFVHMINLARTLSQDFFFVRVDLYNISGKIYFGEMTFTSQSGVARIHPKEYEKMLGDMMELPIIMKPRKRM